MVAVRTVSFSLRNAFDSCFLPILNSYFELQRMLYAIFDACKFTMSRIYFEYIHRSRSGCHQSDLDFTDITLTIEFLYRYANILEFNIDFRTILSRNDLRNPCNFIANKPPSIIQEWEIEGTDVVKIGSGIHIENYNQACIFSIMMNREKRKRKRKKSYENMIERVFRNFRWTKLRIKKRLFRSCPKS